MSTRKNNIKSISKHCVLLSMFLAGTMFPWYALSEEKFPNRPITVIVSWAPGGGMDLNARATNSQIGKRLRINKNVVNYRIKNLEKRGIIKGYNTVINVLGLGYLGHRLYLKLQYADKKAEKRIMDYIRKYPYT